MLLLLLSSSVKPFNNLVHSNASNVQLIASPSMGSCQLPANSPIRYSNITTATDGLMTDYSDDNNCNYVDTLFYILGSGGYLKITLPERSTVRTILLSAREAFNASDGIKISVGDSYPGTMCSA